MTQLFGQRRKCCSLVRWTAFCLCLCSLFGCKEKVPSIDANLVSTYVDICVMEDKLGSDAPDARLARVSIIKSHGYTLESYTKAVDAILEDDTRWVPFQQAVVNRIDSLLGNPVEPPKGAKK